MAYGVWRTALPHTTAHCAPYSKATAASAMLFFTSVLPKPVGLFRRAPLCPPLARTPPLQGLEGTAQKTAHERHCSGRRNAGNQKQTQHRDLCYGVPCSTHGTVFQQQCSTYDKVLLPVLLFKKWWLLLGLSVGPKVAAETHMLVRDILASKSQRPRPSLKRPASSASLITRKPTSRLLSFQSASFLGYFISTPLSALRQRSLVALTLFSPCLTINQAVKSPEPKPARRRQRSTGATLGGGRGAGCRLLLAKRAPLRT